MVNMMKKVEKGEQKVEKCGKDQKGKQVGTFPLFPPIGPFPFFSPFFPLLPTVSPFFPLCFQMFPPISPFFTLLENQKSTNRTSPSRIWTLVGIVPSGR